MPLAALPRPKTSSLTAIDRCAGPEPISSWSAAKLDEESAKLGKTLDHMRNERDTAKALMGWMTQAPKLQKVQGTAWQQLLDAEENGRLFCIADTPMPINAAAMPHIFLICHDWAAAFEGAGDFASGPYRLPFPECCFELQISGRRVCIIATQQGSESPQLHLYFGFNGYWFDCQEIGETDDMHGAFLGKQLRAACIALDANAAGAEPVRASAAQNRARIERGRPLLPDHSIITLSRRAEPGPRSGTASGEGGRRRLHFRRGHWRHYPMYTIWIRWMLVGDPDLGFIEQRYKL